MTNFWSEFPSSMAFLQIMDESLITDTLEIYCFRKMFVILSNIGFSICKIWKSDLRYQIDELYHILGSNSKNIWTGVTQGKLFTKNVLTWCSYHSWTTFILLFLKRKIQLKSCKYSPKYSGAKIAHNFQRQKLMRIYLCCCFT